MHHPRYGFRFLVGLATLSALIVLPPSLAQQSDGSAARASAETAPPTPREPLVAIPRNVADVLPQLSPGAYAAQERKRVLAFQRMMDMLMPMNDEQITSVIGALERNEQLASQPAETPPELVMEMERLDLSASTPPILRVAQGYGGSVVFTDKTGRIWPITAQQGFNPGLFVVHAETITGDKEDLPTVLTIQPTARYGMGNFMVTLKGLETPIIVSVALGQNKVDARKEFRLGVPGPNAKTTYQRPEAASTEPALLNVVNGLPPSADAIAIDVRGVEPEARAWRQGNNYYIRTVARIYSPQPDDKSSSPSGVNAYKLAAVPVILANYNGAMVELMPIE